MRRWWVSLLATTVVNLTAVGVNLATDWRHNLWAWVVIGLLTVAGAGLTVWLAQLDHPAPEVSATGERAVAAGGHVGTAVTGDTTGIVGVVGTAQFGRSETTSPMDPSRSVQAAGTRSVAAAGDLGLAITGDTAPRSDEEL